MVSSSQLPSTSANLALKFHSELRHQTTRAQRHFTTQNITLKNKLRHPVK